jgi:hypothetical protein
VGDVVLFNDTHVLFLPSLCAFAVVDWRPNMLRGLSLMSRDARFASSLNIYSPEVYCNTQLCK